MQIALAFALLAAALSDVPSQAALADARTVAENGMLAAVAGLQMQQEIEQTIADHPELTAAEQGAFRKLALAAGTALTERAIAAEAAAHAEHLSAADLAAIAAHARSDAARAQRQAMPLVIGATIAALSADGEIDFMGSVKAQFCAETGKLCPDDAD